VLSKETASVYEVSAIQPRKQPLTFAALVKRGGGKATKRIQKLDSSLVPLSFSSLVTSWKINTEQLGQYCRKPLSTVLRSIGDVYSEKLFRAKKDLEAKATAKVNSLAQISYQVFSIF